MDVIDFSAHIISEDVGEVLENKKYYGPGRQFPFPADNADVEKRIGVMDKYGVDVQVLTQTSPVLLGFNAMEAAKVCRMSNKANYDLVEENPGRFVGFGILSLLDMDTALVEFDKMINDYKFKGVTISGNQEGKPLDSEEFYPFYEKVVEYDVPIFIHPTHWNSDPYMGMEEGYRIMHIFGWPYDTTQTVVRMMLGGVFDEFPSLKVVTHHLGAMLPYFKTRFELNVNGFMSDEIEKPLEEYYKNVYGDTALDGEASALPCGYNFFGSNRMLFGSDYPFGPENGEVFVRDNLKNVKEMDVPSEAKQKILGGNAKRILDL